MISNNFSNYVMPDEIDRDMGKKKTTNQQNNVSGKKIMVFLYMDFENKISTLKLEHLCTLYISNTIYGI